ncbi:MAG: hypothetical protein O3A00_27380 [Planctomycetota bacterium]|nr:hypothetical protein [Planctomycetota bacterium]
MIETRFKTRAISMTATIQELNNFHQFALQKLASGANDVSLDDLFDMWQIENTSAETREVDLLAVQAAVRDLEGGDRGVPFEEHVRELRDKYDSEGGRGRVVQSSMLAAFTILLF